MAPPPVNRSWQALAWPTLCYCILCALVSHPPFPLSTKKLLVLTVLCLLGWLALLLALCRRVTDGPITRGAFLFRLFSDPAALAVSALLAAAVLFAVWRGIPLPYPLFCAFTLHGLFLAFRFSLPRPIPQCGRIVTRVLLGSVVGWLLLLLLAQGCAYLCWHTTYYVYELLLRDESIIHTSFQIVTEMLFGMTLLVLGFLCTGGDVTLARVAHAVSVPVDNNTLHPLARFLLRSGVASARDLLPCLRHPARPVVSRPRDGAGAHGGAGAGGELAIAIHPHPPTLVDAGVDTGRAW